MHGERLQLGIRFRTLYFKKIEELGLAHDIAMQVMEPAIASDGYILNTKEPYAS
jgi:hypothetical protein